MGSPCEACGEAHGQCYAECICDRVQMSDEFMASLLLDDDEFAAMCAWRRTLAANLAVGGALCAAYLCGNIEGGEWAEGWRPNIDGKPAPGWER